MRTRRTSSALDSPLLAATKSTLLGKYGASSREDFIYLHPRQPLRDSGRGTRRETPTLNSPHGFSALIPGQSVDTENPSARGG